MGMESGWGSEAAGLSMTSQVILGSAGTALGAWLGSPPSS
uniref:Interferon alpha inducible protein 27 like 1 n=1 Tax=Colobus angolensis palliatus TaxID=336983 RepID=A0A2K5K4V6_COLAP